MTDTEEYSNSDEEYSLNSIKKIVENESSSQPETESRGNKKLKVKSTITTESKETINNNMNSDTESNADNSQQETDENKDQDSNTYSSSNNSTSSHKHNTRRTPNGDLVTTLDNTNLDQFNRRNTKSVNRLNQAPKQQDPNTNVTKNGNTTTSQHNSPSVQRTPPGKEWISMFLRLKQEYPEAPDDHLKSIVKIQLNEQGIEQYQDTCDNNNSYHKEQDTVENYTDNINKNTHSEEEEEESSDTDSHYNNNSVSHSNEKSQSPTSSKTQSRQDHTVLNRAVETNDSDSAKWKRKYEEAQERMLEAVQQQVLAQQQQVLAQQQQLNQMVQVLANNTITKTASEKNSYDSQLTLAANTDWKEKADIFRFGDDYGPIPSAVFRCLMERRENDATVKIFYIKIVRYLLVNVIPENDLPSDSIIEDDVKLLNYIKEKLENKKDIIAIKTLARTYIGNIRITRAQLASDISVFRIIEHYLPCLGVDLNSQEATNMLLSTFSMDIDMAKFIRYRNDHIKDEPFLKSSRREDIELDNDGRILCEKWIVMTRELRAYLNRSKQESKTHDNRGSISKQRTVDTLKLMMDSYGVKGNDFLTNPFYKNPVLSFYDKSQLHQDKNDNSNSSSNQGNNNNNNSGKNNKSNNNNNNNNNNKNQGNNGSKFNKSRSNTQHNNAQQNNGDSATKTQDNEKDSKDKDSKDNGSTPKAPTSTRGGYALTLKLSEVPEYVRNKGACANCLIWGHETNQCRSAKSNKVGITLEEKTLSTNTNDFLKKRGGLTNSDNNLNTIQEFVMNLDNGNNNLERDSLNPPTIGPTMHTYITIKDTTVKALIDTGSQVNLLRKIEPNMVIKTERDPINIIGYKGESTRYEMKSLVSIIYHGVSFTVWFYEVNDASEECVLGTAFLGSLAKDRTQDNQYHQVIQMCRQKQQHDLENSSAVKNQCTEFSLNEQELDLIKKLSVRRGPSKIKVNTSQYINQSKAKVYIKGGIQIPQRLLDLTRAAIEEGKKEGYWTECNSAKNYSQMIPMAKGDPLSGVRLVVNFKDLNNDTDSHPIILEGTKSILQWIMECKDYTEEDLQNLLISEVDLSNAYFQIQVDEESQNNLGFVVLGSQYKFKVLPQGLKVSTGVFQEVINTHIIKDSPYMKAYLDNIYVKTKTMAQHHDTLLLLLTRLFEWGFTIAPTKSKFGMKELDLLGNHLDQFGLSANAARLEALRTAELPKTGSDLKSFLATLNFVRKYIDNLAKLVVRLHAATKQTEIKWTDELKHDFEKCREALMHTIKLSVYDPDQEIHIFTDACRSAMGALLVQYDKEGNPRIIDTVSRAFKNSEIAYPIAKKELFAVLIALTSFHHYTKYNVTKVKCDNIATVYALRSLATQTTVQWLVKIMEYDIEIEHIAGQDNYMADFLSRTVFEAEAKYQERLNSIFQLQHSGDTHLRITTNEEAELSGEKEVYQVTDDNSPQGIAVVKVMKIAHQQQQQQQQQQLAAAADEDDLLTKKQKEILQEAHEATAHGSKTLMVLHVMCKGHKIWKNIHAQAQETVKSCHLCARVNTSRAAAFEAQPIVANEIWEVLEMDLIIPSVKDGEFTVLLVIVDVFSRYTIAIPLMDKSANTIAENLLTLFGMFGVPSSIVTDNGGEFKNDLLREIFNTLEVTHNIAVPYKHTTTGIVERKNREIMTIIKKQMEDQRWREEVTKAVWAINARRDQNTLVSPFIQMFIREGRSQQQYNEAVESFNGNRNKAREDLTKVQKDNLEKKNDKVKAAMGKKFVTPPAYTVDSLVYIKNATKTSKMDAEFCGPYRITDVLGSGNYNVSNCNSGKSKTVHTTQMKQFLGQVEADEDIYMLEDILEHKYVKAKLHYLIKWKNYPIEEATWEPAQNILSTEIKNQYNAKHNVGKRRFKKD